MSVTTAHLTTGRLALFLSLMLSRTKTPAVGIQTRYPNPVRRNLTLVDQPQVLRKAAESNRVRNRPPLSRSTGPSFLPPVGINWPRRENIPGSTLCLVLGGQFQQQPHPQLHRIEAIIGAAAYRADA